MFKKIFFTVVLLAGFLFLVTNVWAFNGMIYRIKDPLQHGNITVKLCNSYSGQNSLKVKKGYWKHEGVSGKTPDGMIVFMKHNHFSFYYHEETDDWVKFQAPESFMTCFRAARQKGQKVTFKIGYDSNNSFTFRINAKAFVKKRVFRED